MPDASRDEYLELKASIEAVGLLEPIVTLDGKILDGRHRYRACLEVGTVLRFERFEDLGYQGSEADYVLDKHKRRNLTIEQKATVAVARKKYLQEHVVKRGRPAENMANLPPKGPARDEAASAVGISPRNVDKAEKVADAAPEVFERMKRGEYGSVERAKRVADMPAQDRQRVHELIDAGTTAKDAERDVKQRNRRAERAKMINEIASASTPLEGFAQRFPVIYADPPWQYEHSKTESREIENHYPTMTLDDICDLPVSEVAADDAVLFLWVTSPKLEEGLRVLNAWGFSYRTCMEWDKEVIGMGYYARQQHELLLIGTRGSLPVPPPAARPRSVVREKRSKHSAKPHGFYSLIAEMYPEFSKLELFCRTPQPGWDVWGNQSQEAS